MRDHGEVFTRVRADGFGRSAGAADQPHGVAAAAAFDADGRVRLILTVLAMPDRKSDHSDPPVSGIGG
jgi:hypothetical protein